MLRFATAALVLLTAIFGSQFNANHPAEVPYDAFVKAPYHIVARYVEARIRIENSELKACSEWDDAQQMAVPSTNFDKLPAHGMPRDKQLEGVAIEAVNCFVFKDHNSVSELLGITRPELGQYLQSHYENGDSPWGLYEHPKLAPVLEAYVEDAKLVILGKKPSCMLRPDETSTAEVIQASTE